MDFTGILPAIVTPFHADGSFYEEAYGRHIAALYAAGVHGLYVLGQSGEGMQQPLHQRMQVLEAAVRFSPPAKQVVVHVGANSTADAIELALHAHRAGAHAISSLPPLGAYSYKEIRRYYEKLADSSPLPLLLYHHPESCPELTPERALDLCSISNVIGFKFTDYNVYLLSLIRDRGKLVYNGRDEQLVAGLILGATGGIGTFYNLFPALFVSIFEFGTQGKWAEAAALQRLINPTLELIFRSPLVPSTRYLLAKAGLSTGACVPPRRPLTPEEEQTLDEIYLKMPEKLRAYLLDFKTVSQESSKLSA